MSDTPSAPLLPALHGLLARHGRAVWAATCAVVLAIHALTLTISPPLWQDESQIVDWGRRMIFEPDTDWSFNALPNGVQVPLVSYVGPLLQEVAWRLTSPSPVGPRFTATLGLLAAATALFAWLRRRQVDPVLAQLLATAFLVEPLLTANGRGGRVDGWAIAAILVACASLAGERRRPVQLAVGGAFAALAPLVWPTAAILEPLVLLELLAIRPDAPRRTPSAVVRDALLFAAGALPALAVILGLLFAVHGNPFRHLDQMIGAQLGAAIPQSLRAAVLELALCIARSPILWVMAAVAFAFRRSWLLLAALAAVIAGLLATSLNQNRVVFLLPYAVAFVAAAAPMAERRRLFTGLALAGIAWGAAFSLVARPYTALRERRERDPAQAFEAARTLVGPGPKRVVILPWHFYFPGRSLGWHMLHPYAEIDLMRYVPSVDYAIIYDGMTPELGPKLAAAGFEKVEKPAPAAPTRFPGFDVFRRTAAAPAGAP